MEKTRTSRTLVGSDIFGMCPTSHPSCPISMENFTSIYDQYISRIYRFIFLKVGTRDVAEDLCSEVFLRVYEKYKASDIQNIQAFLYQTARNRVIDYYRDRSRNATIPLYDIHEEDGFGRTDDILGQAIVNSEMEHVHKALKKIHSDYQDLIIWRYVDELTTGEIAQISNKSEGAVRVALHRALKALRDELASVSKHV